MIDWFRFIWQTAAGSRGVFFVAAIFCPAQMALAATRDKLDYNRDIRPILAENCFACHGFDGKARQAELRLDVAEGAFADRDGVVPIAPGQPEKSEAWVRIATDDEDMMMPPPTSHHKLSAKEKQIIKTWIEQGAPFSGHWSFISPKRPPVPKGPDETGNPIDAFIRERLKQEGLKPSKEADRATLIRRVSLDLTGLPPSAEEVNAFVRDPDPKAYEKLIDRLLQSSHFGERMALDWLDAARYADTNGFSIDGGRHMWLWRDWVIQAFNDNKPYDRFLLEQLAGDLLPNRTNAQLIATGFQRNNMVTHEGGTIPEENITNYNADRVKTLGEAVLGLTLGCAQCHDHKYDPITQKDYYSIFAYFNSLDDRGLDGNAGINPNPSFMARTVLKTDEGPQLREQIAELKAKLARRDDGLLQDWESQQREILSTRGRGLKLHPIKVMNIATPNRGAGFDMEGTDRVRLRGVGDLVAFDILAELPKISEPITGLRAVFHPLPEFPGNGWGAGPVEGPRGKGEKPPKGTFRLTAISLTADEVPGDQVNLHKLKEIARVTANSWEPEHPAAECLDPRNETGWSPDVKTEGTVHVTVTFAEPIDSTKLPYLTTQLNFGAGKGLVPGLIELMVITGTDDGVDVPADVLSIIDIPAAKRTPEQSAALWTYCAAHSPQLKSTRIAIANLEERLAALTQQFPTMVMNVAAKPRETFILRRGDYAQPTTKVTAGTIAALPVPATGSASDRLGLAQWVTMKNHPLTARVAVNRFWQMLFGTGLVATTADFGVQGEWPSHPELLDWLAVEFVDSGWDVKKLLRLIVTSSTYRQDSAASSDLLERDPGNRLLARGPRFRLSAELIRDGALKTSGLLVPRIGGPSVNPYTPGDLWREVSHYGSTPATAQTFVQDHGEKLYRRSLYTYWKRTAPPPNMVSFDAPNREVCTVKRAGTTTPLQALVLLNDPQFVEASRAFAERILAQQGSESEKLRWAFIATVAREPSRQELSVLQVALARERKRYASAPGEATAYLSAGESPRNEKLPPTEHAAWSQVAALLLNLSETVTRR